MMHHGVLTVSAALLSALCVGACAKAHTATPGEPPPVSAAAAPAQDPVPPKASPAIVVPNPTMKTVNAETRPPARNALADPLLPTLSETPRLPFDFIIGPIGAADAEQGAYRFVMEFLATLSRGEDVSGLYTDRGRESATEVGLLVAALLPVSHRAGSGVLEGEGEASFLVRLVGVERSSQGELRLVRAGSSWLVDELILDEPVDDYGEDGSPRFDPFSYTRFL